MRPIILVLMDHYLPGYKAGGPPHAIRGLAEALGGEFQFRIVTSDRDFRDKESYPGIRRGCWTPMGNADVLYVNRRNPLSVIRHVLGTPHDVLYLKSFFSRPFSVLPIWMRALGILRSKSVVLAPSGEFAPSALALKPRRKRIYLTVAGKLWVYREAIWHATSEYEAQDIKREFGHEIRTVTARSLGSRNEEAEFSERRVRVFVASELAPGGSPAPNNSTPAAKMPGELRAVFLSRVARNKNLDGALQMLYGLRGRVRFDIYGPLQDPKYWEECQRIIADLPPTIQAGYRGIVPHPVVNRVLSDYHLFFFPTKGENFGFVILEALLAGCPILISDQTPWRNLEEAGVGWDLPLDEPERFRQVLQRCIDMESGEYQRMSGRAQVYGRERGHNPEIVSRNRALFQTALASVTSK